MQQFNKDEGCVHNLFEIQARKTPNSIAVSYKDNKLTYKELDDLSNAFCDYLSEKGFGYGSLIGIFVGDYILIVVAMLGVLKSGGAYIPLDTGYPVKKIADIIEDSNTSVVIAEERLIGLLPCSTQSILIDKVSLKLKDNANKTSLKIYSEVNTIYVLFTSGSTGRPKGVKLIHSAIVNLLNWYIAECNITPSSRILIISSFSFDLTQKNILGGLLAGATVYFVDINPFIPSEIVEAIFLHKITMINCTPSAFYALSDNARDKLFSLNMVVLGGEAINTKKLLKFINTYREVTILNTYGPTECSDIVCCHKITEEEIRENKIIPLGKQIQNTGLLILDDNFHECGINIIGEGYIIGVGVGIEYINNPILTSERFLQNPFCCAGSNNKVMYKTGDLLKKLPNGLYQYVGRNDDQVKVHGCRVELEEIERHLERIDNIKQAVVVADKINDTNTLIIAYIALYNKTKKVDDEAMRASLKEYLELYMIPAFFIIMDDFPLTQNKKINKKLLATRNFYHKRIQKNSLVNGDSIEIILSQIWSEALSIPAEKINIIDNFFDLGGYSLLAVKIIGRVEQFFGKRLSILQLIENPTIEKLAVLVKQEVSDYRPTFLTSSIFDEKKNCSFRISKENMVFMSIVSG